MIFFVTFSSEDERLAEASVSHEFVVEQSSLPFYTHQRPADVIISRPGVKDMHVAMETDERKDGENKMKTAGSNSNEQTLVNVDNKKKDNIDIECEKGSSNCRKKKKKKKKSSWKSKQEFVFIFLIKFKFNSEQVYYS